MKDTYLIWFYLPSWISFFSILVHVLFLLLFSSTNPLYLHVSWYWAKRCPGEENATHSVFLHGKFHGRRKPGRLQSTGSECEHTQGCALLFWEKGVSNEMYFPVSIWLWDWDVLSQLSRQKMPDQDSPYLKHSPLKQISRTAATPKSVWKHVRTRYQPITHFSYLVHFQLQILSNTISFFCPSFSQFFTGNLTFTCPRKFLFLFLAGCVRKMRIVSFMVKFQQLKWRSKVMVVSVK